MSKPFTTEYFIQCAESKFHKKFDYSQVTYVNASTKIRIVCPHHGEFEITPDSHLNSAHGCKKCGTDAMAKLQKERTFAKFKQSILEDQKYDYSLSFFEKIHDKIEVVCPDHGSYFVTVDHHLRGVRCKQCAILKKTGGYSEKWFSNNPSEKNAPGSIYLLRMFDDTEEFLKVGITINSIQQRYRGSKYKYEILRLHRDNLYACYQFEKKIKKQFKSFLYQNKKELYRTESFQISILPEIICLIP